MAIGIGRGMGGLPGWRGIGWSGDWRIIRVTPASQSSSRVGPPTLLRVTVLPDLRDERRVSPGSWNQDSSYALPGRTYRGRVTYSRTASRITRALASAQLTPVE